MINHATHTLVVEDDKLTSEQGENGEVRSFAE